jgi:hypothetical protein
MIEIRWNEKTSEIDLGGTPEDLQYIRQSILRLIRTGEVQISISANLDFEPAPYSSRLSFLIIRKSVGFTKVIIATDHLEVKGNPDNLATFAEWFDFEDSVSNYHCHFDYYEGNEWIAPDSLPLVISVR